MKRSPGRPPLNTEDPSIKVSISLPSKQFDAFCARALRDKVSVPEIIRRQLDATKSTKK
jgi:hypothetical protein